MIYDGTLYGHWEAIVTMQQLIVLATPDGVVEMTPQAIAARTSIPFDIIEKGLKVLSQPDPYSRTPGEDGKRIVLMDESRPWGWRLVNHGKYVRLRNMAQKREADRARIAEKRSVNKNVAIESQPVANVAHSDSYSYSDTKRTTLSSRLDVARLVLDFLNTKTGRYYRPVKANLEIIAARLADGATEQELCQVVAKKCREWAGDEKMVMYLRPATLFNRTKFAQYQGELLCAAPTATAN